MGTEAYQVKVDTKAGPVYVRSVYLDGHVKKYTPTPEQAQTFATLRKALRVANRCGGIIRAVTVCAAMVFLASCTVTAPVAITAQPLLECSKVGTSKAVTVLGFVVGGGDAGTAAAMHNGGLSVPCVVDHAQAVYLGGLVTVRTTTVHGK